MPYEVTFIKKVAITDRERYINECCVGGDVVVDRLLPAVKQRYTDVQTNQEDWGWFIWFRGVGARLAIDVFTDDPEQGAFRIHLTSRVRRLLFFDSIADTSELDQLRDLVESELMGWADGRCRVTRLDKRYM